MSPHSLWRNPICQAAFALAVLLALGTACGKSGSTPAVDPSSAESDIRITSDNNGANIGVTAGSIVRVELTPTRQGWHWHGITVTDDSVLSPLAEYRLPLRANAPAGYDKPSIGVASPGGGMLARLRAMSRGQVTLKSDMSPDCPPNVACDSVVRPFTVVVTVRSG